MYHNYNLPLPVSLVMIIIIIIIITVIVIITSRVLKIHELQKITLLGTSHILRKSLFIK